MVFLPIWKMIGFWIFQCYGLKRKMMKRQGLNGTGINPAAYRMTPPYEKREVKAG